jgi:hypothetical protein
MEPERPAVAGEDGGPLVQVSRSAVGRSDRLTGPTKHEASSDAPDGGFPASGCFNRRISRDVPFMAV